MDVAASTISKVGLADYVESGRVDKRNRSIVRGPNGRAPFLASTECVCGPV